MLKKNRKFIILACALLTIIVVGLSTSLYSSNSQDVYFNVRKYITLFGEVYKEVTSSYVEEIDTEKFIRAGIQGMLDQLDPYTVYLEDEGKDELEIMTRGKYFGVGMRISLRNGWPTVAEQPFPNSPAAIAGIREGDQIIQIDGITTKGDKLSKTAARLRGTTKGTEVRITISRVSVEKPMELTLIRDEIVVSEIEFAGIVEPGIGLIRLTRFNRGAGRQVQQAIETLKAQGMQSLIFDLRSNPGGLLDVAVSVLENFVAEGELVVYTKGRNGDSQQDYRTRIEPVLGKAPLVVLVDGYSASASEIVAGAIQDLDRGVIIGGETFGKGLVQTVVNLDQRGDAKLKITTAQYFMPSGRLIQRPEVFNRGRGSVLANSLHVDDNGYDEDEEITGDEESEKEKDPKQTLVDKDLPKFYTRNNREVLGGGGIKPDIKVENQRTTKYVAELRRKSLFFNFSLNYAADHSTLDRDFEVTDQMLEDFFAFTREKEFDYIPDGYKELETLEKIARDEQYYDIMKAHIQEIRNDFKNVKEQDKNKSTEDIRYLLKRELTAKLFGNDEAYRAGFERDDDLKAAISVLKNPDEYNKVLNIKVATKN
ncbi:MAG TPA: S41 family peptidase [bacterium]|nr:S41 family peptidase [bacterium]HPN45183.1 S41 family peptidase [bacterium]